MKAQCYFMYLHSRSVQYPAKTQISNALVLKRNLCQQPSCNVKTDNLGISCHQTTYD